MNHVQSSQQLERWCVRADCWALEAFRWRSTMNKSRTKWPGALARYLESHHFHAGWFREYRSLWTVASSMLILLGVCSCALASVRAEPAVLEFGVIKPATQGKQSFQVINDGSSAVKILGVEVECKTCTHVTLESTSLEAGKSLEVPVIFAAPAGEEGPVHRQLAVLVNDKVQSRLPVALRAWVTKTAGLWPSELVVATPQAPEERLHRDLELVNVSDKPLKVLYSVSALQGPRIAGPHDAILPGQRGKLNVTWDLPAKPGQYSGQAVIYVDHVALTKLILPYSAVVGDKEEKKTGNARSGAGGEASLPRLPEPSMAQPATVAARNLSAQAPSGATQPATRVQLQLKDGLTLKDLVEVIASQLHLNLIYDEAALNVPVTVRLTGALEQDALLPLLKSVLQAKGFALVGTDRTEIWRILPTKEAPQAVNLNNPAGGPDQLVTDVITPHSMEPETLASILKGFTTTATGQVTAVPKANLVIVTDYKLQVDRLRDLVKIVDRVEGRTEAAVEVVPVHAAEVGPLVERVNKLLTQLNAVEGLKGDHADLFVSPDTQNNQIVLVGRSSQFPRVQEMIRRFDVAPSAIRVNYVLRDDQLTTVPALVNQVLSGGTHKQASGQPAPVLLSGTTLSVLATEGEHQRIREILEERSPEDARQELKLKAYRIQNRDAAEVEATLVRLFGGSAEKLGRMDFVGQESATKPPSNEGVNRVGNPIPAPPETAKAPISPSSTSPSQSSTTGADGKAPLSIALDVGTNTLLIAASNEMHRRIGEVIQQLDRRQAQVLLEVMLVAVTDSNAFSYAVEAALRTTGGPGANEQLFASNFGIGSGSPANRTLNVGPGFNAAIMDPGNFSVFVQALAQTNKAKSMSLPQVLALDNKQALIRSVQQEPFTSLNASQTVSTTSFGGFAEAGTTLEITPHIAPADYLNLEYRLEVSSFTGSSPAPSVPPPRRSDVLSSVVSVPDGHTVIIGGLKTGDSSQSVSKIPGFGDIPILGILGRSQNNSQDHSTFYVFVRPTILRAGRFEDLRYLSEKPRHKIGLPSDAPALGPLYMK